MSQQTWEETVEGKKRSAEVFSPAAVRQGLVLLLAPLTLGLATLLYPPGAVAEALKVRGAAGAAADSAVMLVSAEGRHWVEKRDGAQVKLPLSPRALVEDFQVAGDGWLAAATEKDDRASSLALLRGRGGEVALLASPTVAAPLVREPHLMVTGGELRAAVWLEGEAINRMSVRAARWQSDGWSAPETVAPPGRGTQIALATAVLDDGSWLAVWAAFDGRDDEIVWSRLAGDSWSPPQPVTAENAVPDVTPQVIAVPGGALAAWSRYDGNDYRVVTARFDGKAWTQPEILGPSGSLYPAFSDGPLLLYRRAQPQGWTVLKLDPTGKVLRTAEVAAENDETPVVAQATEETVVLTWPGGEKAASVTLEWKGR